MECTKISVPLPIKPNVNSENVIKMLKENSSIKNECIRMFEEEIELLGEEDPTIIALGNKTLKILMDNFGGKYRMVTCQSKFRFVPEVTLTNNNLHLLRQISIVYYS